MPSQKKSLTRYKISRIQFILEESHLDSMLIRLLVNQFSSQDLIDPVLTPKGQLSLQGTFGV